MGKESDRQNRLAAHLFCGYIEEDDRGRIERGERCPVCFWPHNHGHFGELEEKFCGQLTLKEGKAGSSMT